jgi:hypothetical protein
VAASATAAPKQAKPIGATVHDLATAYAENEVRADARFKGKRVLLVGYVRDVSKDIMDKAFVMLESGGDEPGLEVQAYPSKRMIATGHLARFDKGDRVALECTCDGKLIHLQMSQCDLRKHTPIKR